MFEVKFKKNKTGRHASGHKIVFVRHYLTAKYVAEGFQNCILFSMLNKVIVYDRCNGIMV